jgi:hypothetical protein
VSWKQYKLLRAADSQDKTYFPAKKNIAGNKYRLIKFLKR